MLLPCGKIRLHELNKYVRSAKLDRHYSLVIPSAARDLPMMAQYQIPEIPRCARDDVWDEQLQLKLIYTDKGILT